MSTLIYWFRNDLRLTDNPAFARACRQAERLLPVYCHAPEAATDWGFARLGAPCRAFLAAGLDDLAGQLAARGSRLLELHGPAAERLAELARAVGAQAVHAEAIAAPEELQEEAALRCAGLRLETHWQSSLLDPAALPFPCAELPAVFSAFRNRVERAGVTPQAPQAAAEHLPPLPAAAAGLDNERPPLPLWHGDPRSAFPFAAGEGAAQAHLRRYFASDLPVHYKATRNGLCGADYSSKLSPWLASGALSPRSVHAALRTHEAAYGASDGSYWLWFELLWRDYFRFLHRQHGARLYRARGLAERAATPRHDAAAFARWCRGQTGEPLVDAGMRELAASGYLSNRMRQVVASYLIHDLGGDWRAGAAWFEAQLLDYDVYSNQGNWLYIAGRGTDPRGGRRFNPQKQAAEYDPQGVYRALWAGD